MLWYILQLLVVHHITFAHGNLIEGCCLYLGNHKLYETYSIEMYRALYRNAFLLQLCPLKLLFLCCFL